MIRPLRQRHRRMFAVLGVALPVALIVGIAARRPVPTVASLPGGISGKPHRFTASQWSRDDLFTKTPIHVVLVRERAGSAQFAAELSAPKNFAKPDLLVYWIAGNATTFDTIPDNAVLLGSFNNYALLPLPRGAAQSSAVLILYSLANHEVIDVSKPISF